MDGYVLIVDDDQDIRNMVAIYLENAAIPFIKCENAIIAMELLQQYKVDLILLDIMLPELDGMDACIKIRQEHKIPIIFMSAKAQDMDKIQGLSVGADDYITKPFNPIELVARVKAQLRRFRQYNDGSGATTIQYKDLELNEKTRQVWLKGVEKKFTPKEFAILEYLLQNKGLTLTIRQIYEHVWKEEFWENDSTVLMHISNIRDKLEEDAKGFQYVKTVWGVGYRI